LFEGIKLRVKIAENKNYKFCTSGGKMLMDHFGGMKVMEDMWKERVARDFFHSNNSEHG